MWWKWCWGEGRWILTSWKRASSDPSWVEVTRRARLEWRLYCDDFVRRDENSSKCHHTDCESSCLEDWLNAITRGKGGWGRKSFSRYCWTSWGTHGYWGLEAGVKDGDRGWSARARAFIGNPTWATYRPWPWRAVSRDACKLGWWIWTKWATTIQGNIHEFPKNDSGCHANFSIPQRFLQETKN